MHEDHLDPLALRGHLDALLADAEAAGHDVRHLAPRPGDPAIVLARTAAVVGRRYPGSARRTTGALVGVLALASLALPILAAPAGAATVSDDTSFRDAWADPTVAG